MGCFVRYVVFLLLCFVFEGLGEGRGERGFEGQIADWKQDVTIEYGGDLAKKDLAALGWNQQRNKCRPPVWLVLHKNE